MARIGDRTEPMSPQAALLQHLRDLKRSRAEADGESAATRDAWVRAVDSLLAWIRAWLQRAVNEGLARVDLATVRIQDVDHGAYDAPALRLTLGGGRIVWIRPAGMMRVGARGIVDMVCGSSRALIVLNRSGLWKIRSPAHHASLVVLDEGSFSRVLGELIL
jgi:hypothetical protein